MILVRAGPATAWAVLIVACTPPDPSPAARRAEASGSGPLWADATEALLDSTAQWTNKVELADLDADGRIDLLFANGGDYSTPGTPERNRAFLNRGPGARFEEITDRVFGMEPDLARVVKARDLDGDGLVDVFVGTTYQTMSRLYAGTGAGGFVEVSGRRLPRLRLSVGDAEPGDVDGDGDLDLVLADWGPGNNMTNEGGRTRLWLNDGTGTFVDATDARMPQTLVRFSWDLELVDVDNDFDLDVVVSCKRCGGGLLLRNDGTGTFVEDPRGLPAYTNNYDYEPMDLDGDGFLDLVTINDGDIVGEVGYSRREHVLRNDGRGRFRDATDAWWPDSENVGEDDNVAAFLDADSDGDADFVVGSLSGPDRLLLNDGVGRLTVRLDAFSGPDTPGTLGLALADLDGDGRLDAVQAQGENPEAERERIHLGIGLPPDVAAPSIGPVRALEEAGTRLVRARVHDRKSPSLAADWRTVEVRWSGSGEGSAARMHWYGEYLWWAAVPPGATGLEVCAEDASGNRACRAVPEPS